MSAMSFNNKKASSSSKEFIHPERMAGRMAEEDDEEGEVDVEEERLDLEEAEDEDGLVDGVSGVCYQFKDTCSFQHEALASLAERLSRSGKELSIVKESPLVRDTEGRFSEELYRLAHKKIAFPYEMLTSTRVLQRTHPPSKEDFHSSLGIGSDIGNKQYAEFVQTWEILRKHKYGQNMNLGQYMDFYCILDTLLLAEVHDSFRRLVKQEYGLSLDW